jgi:hypothetical protein
VCEITALVQRKFVVNRIDWRFTSSLETAIPEHGPDAFTETFVSDKFDGSVFEKPHAVKKLSLNDFFCFIKAV